MTIEKKKVNRWGVSGWKKTEEEKRTCRFYVKVTETQKKELFEYCKGKGVSVSGYLRCLITDDIDKKKK